MSSQIIARRAENTIDLYVDGESFKRVFPTEDAAKEEFQAILKVKADPTPKGITELKERFDPVYKFNVIGTLQQNGKNEFFVEGVPIPLPIKLMERMKSQLEAGEPIESLVNFWKWLCLNPDTHVRKSLFSFMETFDMPVTDNGYFIAYKSVAWSGIRDKAYAELVSAAYIYKKAARKDPNDVLVYQNVDENGNAIVGSYFSINLSVEEDIKEEDYITETYEEVTLKELLNMTPQERDALIEDNDKFYRSIKVGYMPILVGQAGDLFAALGDCFQQDENEFTDWHTMSSSIKLGQPSSMPREDCDNNEDQACSAGLHVGAPGYVSRFYRHSEDVAILACLVNPMNVVAIPRDYSYMKMRTCEYLPYALCEMEDGKIKEIEAKYFEEDYSAIQISELQSKLEELEAEGDTSQETLALNTIIRDRIVSCK